MTWSDCEKAWQRQEPRAVLDVASLESDFERRRRELARARVWRDVLEGLPAPIFCVGLFVLWLRIRVWPIWLAMGLLMLGTVWVLLRRRRENAGRPGADAPLLTKVEADLAAL